MLTEKTPLAPLNEILLNPIENVRAEVLTPENQATEVKAFWEGVQLAILN